MSSTISMVDEVSLRAATAGSVFWKRYLAQALASSTVRVHLGVFIEPYLAYVLDGSKTVESRFATRATPPYEKVGPGDVILVKRTGGDIEGICRASDAWYYHLEPSTWREIRRDFGKLMRVSREFLQTRMNARFATLIRLDEVYRLSPLSVRKRDRRGWVVLKGV